MDKKQSNLMKAIPTGTAIAISACKFVDAVRECSQLTDAQLNSHQCTSLYTAMSTTDKADTFD
jgi:hypothetical protein